MLPSDVTSRTKRNLLFWHFFILQCLFPFQIICIHSSLLPLELTKQRRFYKISNNTIQWREIIWWIKSPGGPYLKIIQIFAKQLFPSYKYLRENVTPENGKHREQFSKMCTGIEERVTQLDPRHSEDFTACLTASWLRAIHPPTLRQAIQVLHTIRQYECGRMKPLLSSQQLLTGV